MVGDDTIYNKLLDIEDTNGLETADDASVSSSFDGGYANVRGSRLRFTDGSISDNNFPETSDNALLRDENDSKLNYFGYTRKEMERFTRIGLFTLFGIFCSLVLYISIAAIFHSYVYSQYSPNDYVINNNPILGTKGAEPTGVIFKTSADAGLGTEENPIVVNMSGDSMIYNTCVNNNLIGKLTERLAKHTDLKFKFTNHGKGGQVIAKIGEVIVPDIIADNASIVILMWDSDATDSHTFQMTQAEYEAFVNDYTITLKQVMTNVLALPQVKFFAIAGPSIFGEGPLFRPSIITPDKDNVLKQLRQINVDIAEEFQVPYIDMNHALHSVAWTGWGPYKAWSTVDGEHYAELGASVEADNFVRFLTY